ncbi:LVIVD repeat-containing protein [Marmoricola sp. RAF53]|uniref:LVIVD repeat-containing protein n=1 Tax=Marmoricola sp. RAF53 TaxID=3233059 RepID=UPI003F97C41D
MVVRTARSGRAALRRLLVVVALCLGLGAAWSLTGIAGADDVPDRQAVPQADCGPGALPETSTQGRVPKSDFDSGRAAQGYLCNTAEVAHQGVSGGFKTLRYTDAQGNTCAFYDSTALVPPTSLITNLLSGAGVGVVVLDMNDPAHPKRTANLTTPAMLAPHESLLVNQQRGLLVGTLGTALTAPGALDVYDVRTDCRKPRLLSTSLAGILGHETGFAPDGKTLYVSSTIFTLVAVDLTDPRFPETITVIPNVQYHGMRLSDDGRTLYAAHIGQPGPNLISGGGLRILDVSQIQDRKPNPQVPVLATMTWHGSSIPQVAEPFTRDGHQYLLEVDEFQDIFSLSGLTDLVHSPVGAARIINVDDPRHPFQVSDIRLQVHQPAEHAGEQRNDPGAASPLGGYAGHYCGMPTRDNPDIAGCSMILSGLRLFDIRDVEHPKEVGYFNKPTSSGSAAYSQPAWDPANGSVWYTDTSTGFWNVRLTNGVQDLLP